MSSFTNWDQKVVEESKMEQEKNQDKSSSSTKPKSNHQEFDYSSVVIIKDDEKISERNFDTVTTAGQLILNKKKSGYKNREIKIFFYIFSISFQKSTPKIFVSKSTMKATTNCPALLSNKKTKKSPRTFKISKNAYPN